LTAARWAGDWAGAKEIWKRMTGRLPGNDFDPITARREGQKKANQSRERSESRIIGGNTYDPSNKTMSLLLKVSLNKGNRDVQTALDTFESYGVDFFFPASASASGIGSEDGAGPARKEDKADVVWKKELAKDVTRAGERVLEKEQDADRRERIGRMLRSVAARS
jgi:hypothetical protein